MQVWRVMQYSIFEILRSLVEWPIWWYTVGLVEALKRTWAAILYQAEYLAIGIWVKNIFVPMFGQRDWQSRIISFMMRVVNIIGRSLFLAVWAMICLFGFLLYLLTPVLLITGLVAV